MTTDDEKFLEEVKESFYKSLNGFSKLGINLPMSPKSESDMVYFANRFVGNYERLLSIIEKLQKENAVLRDTKYGSLWSDHVKALKENEAKEKALEVAEKELDILSRGSDSDKQDGFLATAVYYEKQFKSGRETARKALFKIREIRGK